MKTDQTTRMYMLIKIFTFRGILRSRQIYNSFNDNM